MSMDRENQRISLTKRLLKESLLRLMQEKEVDKINVTELCRLAGINRATFYRHYEIPRDVLLEIEKDLFLDLRRDVPMPKNASDIRPCLNRLCRFMADHQELLRVLVKNNSDLDFAMFINDIYLEMGSEFRTMAPFDKYTEEDIRLISLYSAGGSYFLLRHWLMGNIRRSADEVADYIYEILQKTDLDALIRQLRIKL